MLDSMISTHSGTLLEIAICCGLVKLAKWLASIGCDARGVTSASLLEYRNVFQGILQLPGPGMCSALATHEAKQLEAAEGVYWLMRARYHLPALQLLGWWRRDLAAGTIHVRNAEIIDHVAEFAYAMPVLAEFGARRSRPYEPAAGFGCTTATWGPLAAEETA